LRLDPASLVIFAHLAISERMKAPSCSGFIGATSVPMTANRSTTSGFASAAAVSWWRRATTWGGVPAGAISANQAISS
jgi:hypothetical protein